MNIEQAKAVQEFNKAEGRANAVVNSMLPAVKEAVQNHPVLRHLACRNGERELTHAMRFGIDLESLENGCRDYRIKNAEIMVKKGSEYLELLIKEIAPDKDIQGATANLTIYRNDLRSLRNGGF